MYIYIYIYKPSLYPHPSKPRQSPIRLNPNQMVPRYLLHSLTTGQAHAQLKLLIQQFQCQLHPGLSIILHHTTRVSLLATSRKEGGGGREENIPPTPTMGSSQSSSNLPPVLAP